MVASHRGFTRPSGCEHHCVVFTIPLSLSCITFRSDCCITQAGIYRPAPPPQLQILWLSATMHWRTGKSRRYAAAANTCSIARAMAARVQRPREEGARECVYQRSRSGICRFSPCLLHQYGGCRRAAGQSTRARGTFRANRRYQGTVLDRRSRRAGSASSRRCWLGGSLEERSHRFSEGAFSTASNLIAAVRCRTKGSNAPITYGRMAFDAIGLLDYLGIHSAHVIGHSDGGCTTLHLLIDYSDRVRSATLIGTPFNTDNYPPKVFEELQNAMRMLAQAAISAD